MSEEYSLNESEKAVGQLLPIIKDAHGKIVDGLHREESNPNWKTEVRPEIKTDEDYWKARAHLNFTRRNAQEAREEKLKIVDSLAEYYQKQGYNVSGAKRSEGHQGGGNYYNEVLDAVIKALNGAIPESWIRHNIDKKYLQDQEIQTKQIFTYRDTPKAIDALKSDKASVEYRYGKNFVDRLESEIKKETKEELLKDPEFVVEAISKTPEIIERIPEPEYPKISKEQIEQTAEGLRQVQDEIKERKKDPELIKRGKLVKNWMAHTRILGVMESLRCPICDSDATNLVWKCHNLTVEAAHKKIKEKLED